MDQPLQSPSVKPTDEFSLIEWIRARSGRGDPVRLGIGDDCAVLRQTSGAETLVTTDMLMDGRHFHLAEVGPEAVGFKALAVNLSDIAAMAGIPTAAFVSVALPRTGAVEIAQGLHTGLTRLADRFGVTLAGGDTNAWDGPLVINVTLLGETTGSGPVLRSRAQANDVVFVTGPLGGSILGRHLTPEPRINAALALHRATALHAMIDISDGLASDLGHILDESGALGATLDGGAIPIHEDADALSRNDGRAPLEHALADGEDFELCFTVAPEDAARLLTMTFEGFRLSAVGRIEAQPGLRLRASDGSIAPLVARGFNHLAQASSRNTPRS
jgi:thiamine-monophosphate kinase